MKFEPMVVQAAWWRVVVRVTGVDVVDVGVWTSCGGLVVGFTEWGVLDLSLSDLREEGLMLVGGPVSSEDWMFSVLEYVSRVSLSGSLATEASGKSAVGSGRRPYLI